MRGLTSASKVNPACVDAGGSLARSIFLLAASRSNGRKAMARVQAKMRGRFDWMWRIGFINVVLVDDMKTRDDGDVKKIHLERRTEEWTEEWVDRIRERVEMKPG
jgi:hypothetical protein